MISLREKWIHYIRQQELQALGIHLNNYSKKNAELLDIGGGDGFIAKCLFKLGFRVTSTDPAPRYPSYFNVLVGNSMNLNFKDNQFDVVFSSNVLEHISDLNKALLEMKRVLKPSGIMIHTVPTNYSTIYTLITQPAGYLLKLIKAIISVFQTLLSKILNKRINHTGVTSTRLSKKEAIKLLYPIRFFIPGPHGTSENCFTEMKDWNAEQWVETIKKSYLCDCEIIQMPIAYSRNRILPFMFISLRRWVVKLIGASCVALVISFSKHPIENN